MHIAQGKANVGTQIAMPATISKKKYSLHKSYLPTGDTAFFPREENVIK